MNSLDVLFYSSPKPMWIFNIATLQILEVNNAAITQYGYSKEEFLKKTIKDLRSEEELPRLEKALAQIKTAGNKTYFDFVHQDKKGRRFNVEINSFPTTYNGVAARIVTAEKIGGEKQAMLGKLEFAQIKLEKILESTGIGFLQLDNHWHITYWNRAAETMIGYNREYVIGKNIWDVFPEAVSTGFYQNYRKAMVMKIAIEFTEYFWPVQKWFTVNIYPVDEGLIVHFTDVTFNKLSSQKLLEKIEQLKEVSFLNSHYIRKPVASLLGLTNLINEDIINESEFKELARYIHECSLELDTVLRVINSRVNEDDQAVEHLTEGMENFSISVLVKEIIGHLQSTRSNIILATETELSCYGNRQNIAIAVGNLLNNAIKFSPVNTPILVTLDVIDQNLVITIKDQGIGMPKELLSKVFLSFTQKELARGLGTGLAKAAEIAAKHNGNIWIESKLGEGASVSIRFPFSNISEYKKSGIADFSIYKAPGIDIDYNEEYEFITSDWKGFQSNHSVKTGCLKLLGVINNKQAKLLLNDNTHVLGNWGDAVGWVAEEFFPIMESAGITHIAWIYSPSTFSQLAADNTIEKVQGNITTKTFNNKADAMKWLTHFKSEVPTL
jgi:PAS domain S-box-containing protein